MADDSDAVIVRILALTKEYDKQMKNVAAAAERAARAAEKAFENSGKKIGAGLAQAGAGSNQAFRQASQAAGQLSFQLNDIAVGLAGGLSPFQIMMQQGSQVVQVMQQVQAQGGSMGKVVAAAFGSMLNPLSLVSFALIAAAGYAYQYFFAVDEGSEKANKELEKHNDAIRALSKEWGDLNPAAKSAIDEIMNIREVRKAVADAEAEIKNIREEAGKAVGTFTELDRSKVSINTTEQFTILSDLNAAIDAIDAGNSGLEEMARLKIYIGTIPLDRGQEELLRKWEEINGLLKERAKLTTAVAKLQKTISESGPDDREKVKAYNDAMKEMEKVAKGPLTDVQKVLEQHQKALQNATGNAEEYAAALAKANNLSDLAMNQLEIQSLNNVAGLSNISDYMKRVMGAESGGQVNAKNPLSSAQGLFQFTDSTWLRVIKSMNEYAGMTDRQILANKTNVAMQTAAMEKFTQENEAYLRQYGVEVNDTTRYLAHFAGAEGARKIMQAAPGTSAESILGKKAVQANPFLEGMTREQIINWSSKKMGAGQAAVTTEDSQRRLENDREIQKIEGNITKEYDAQAAAEAEKKELAELRQDAEKKAMEDYKAGKRDSAELSKQELDAIAKIAKERGELVGHEEGQKAFEERSKTWEGRIQQLKDEATLAADMQTRLGANAQALDQERVAREANNAALKEEQELRKNGVIVTDEQKAAILAQTTALANSKIAIEEFNTKQKTVNQTSKDFAQQIAQMGQSAIGGLVNDLRNGVEAGEAFNNMLNRILDSLIQMALQSLFSPAGLGQFFGMPVGHKGGRVGQLSERRRISPLAFAGAQRYHSGGIVGLRAGEVPIIAQRGEVIIPTSKVKYGAGATQPVSEVNTTLGDVNIDMSKSGAVAASNDDAITFGKNVQKLIQLEMVRESRPGGLLRKVP